MVIVRVTNQPSQWRSIVSLFKVTEGQKIETKIIYVKLFSFVFLVFIQKHEISNLRN